MLNSIIEKRSLSVNEIENQMAFELPERETPGALVVIGCLVGCGSPITVIVKDNNVAAQICAQVNDVINAEILTVDAQKLTCHVYQT
jgi:hypothetical protein